MIDLDTGERVNGVVQLVHSRIVHAGPTTGKSTLLVRANQSNVVGLDSDRMLECLTDSKSSDSNKVGGVWWWTKKAHAEEKLAKSVTRAFRKANILQHMHVLSLTEGGFILSNIAIGPSVDGVAVPKCVSFFVEPEEMVERSIARDKKKAVPKGHGFQLSLVRKWFDSWKAQPASAFTKRFVLGPGEYLSDVLDVKCEPFTLKAGVDAPFINELLEYQKLSDAYERKRVPPELLSGRKESNV